ncbi:sodium-translocating pyrophosphatase [bacterium]|nr:sodium-translocating pyrophosphatase [bacterium]
MNSITISIALMGASSLIAFLFAVIINITALKGNIRDKKIVDYVKKIKSGVLTYLKEQYKIFGIIFGIVMIILIIMAFQGFVPFYTPFAAFTGAFFSAFTGNMSVRVAVRANGLTAAKSLKSLRGANNVSYLAGSVTGLLTQGVILFDLALWWAIIYFTSGIDAANLTVLILSIGKITTTFGVGASSYALIARVGGGILTKGADIGADMAGKVILNLDEDSPLNPGVVADNVGDNAGDINGMFADLYESTVGALVGSTLLCGTAFAAIGLAGEAVLLPMSIMSFGVIASLVGFVFAYARKDSEKEILRANQRGLIAASILMAIFGYFAAKYTIGIEYWYSILVGLIMANVLSFVPEYYTSHKFKPITKIAKDAKKGAANAVIGSLENGSRSAAVAIFILSIGIIVAYRVVPGTLDQKLASISITAVSMLSFLAFILASDAQGPITDNAQGINEMTGAPEEAIERTNILDALGNTAAAKLKGFSIGSAAMTALVMIGAYLTTVKLSFEHYGIDAKLDLAINNPNVVAGIFIGGAIVYLFTAGLLNSVNKAAGAMIENIKEQAKRFLKDGEKVPGEEPDYNACIEITTKEAQKGIIMPIIIAFSGIIIPGLIGGPEMIAGVLMGTTAIGILSGLFQANAGGAADNAKKLIESGKYGGKKSEAHKASVVADTVGDPLKDTSGPSINILIKLMSMIAIVTANLVVSLYF